MTNFTGQPTRTTSADVERIAMSIDVDVPALRAVLEVESRNSGFDAKRRPIILFEPHVFYRQLLHNNESALDAAVAAKLAYRNWGSKPYPRTSDGNYARLEAAIAIDEEAAFRSVSIGLGQILGENYKAAGHSSAKEMFNSARNGEAAQLRQMANFIRSQGLADELRRRDWEGFARQYNGQAYAKNAYHKKLAKAYQKWKQLVDKPREELTVADLKAAGSGVVMGTSQAKASIMKASAAVAAANEMASQVHSVATPFYEASDNFNSAAGAFAWLSSNWQLVAMAACVAVSVYFVWSAWQGLRSAEEARLQDARDGTNMRI